MRTPYAKPSLQQIETILRLQAQFNRKVDPRWEEKYYPFMRAVLVEVVEALDHYGWKWWSHQERHLDRMTLELMDILGLLVSDALQRCRAQSRAAAHHVLAALTDHAAIRLPDGMPSELDAYNIPELLDLVALSALCQSNALSLVQHLFVRLSLSWREVVRIFFAKTVLNIFRQDHGYRGGSYSKYWGPSEDNEHLWEIMATTKWSEACDEEAFELLYQALERRYIGYAGKTHSGRS